MTWITNVPRHLNWNFTHLCNFFCRHCYSRRDEYRPELNTEQALAAVQRIINANIFQVNLGGGEPLLREDCYKVILALTKGGVCVTLSTNGWVADRNITRILKEVGLSSLYVSIDHIDPSHHDDFRRKPGSYVRALQCIENAQLAGLETCFSTVVTRENLCCLDDLAELAKRLGVSSINFKRFRPVGEGRKSRGWYELHSTEEWPMLEKMARLRKCETPRIYFIYGDFPIPGIDEGCPCGKKTMGMRPNGDLVACVYHDYVLGNILRDDIEDIWRNHPYLLSLRKSFRCLARDADPCFDAVSTEARQDVRYHSF